MLSVPDPSIERVRPPLSTNRRWLRWAALASVLVHAALFGAILWWTRAPRKADVALHPVTQPPIVQLVMSPPGTDHNAPPSEPHVRAPRTTKGVPQPAKPTPPKPEMAAAQKPPEQKPTKQTPQTARQSVPLPPTPQPAEEKPPEAAPAETEPADTAQAAPPAAQAFAMNPAAIESDTNALVTGNTVVPPSPDIKYHNRKPSYPTAAALRGEQGTVVLLVHVQPDGLVSGVDVERSSGYARLDDSALDAVRTWHFLPSIEDGEPVGAVVPVRIVYALDR